MSPNQNNEDISAYGVVHSTIKVNLLDAEQLHKMNVYFRASLYLCLGMLYLRENFLLKKPLQLDHIKARLLGHWGSDAGQSFTWTHMNRLIKKYDLDVLFLLGPNHGAPDILSQSYLEGVYSEIYPDKGENEEGMKKLFKQFSFPGGIGGHATPETPGSIHEGGELGYSISHAFGTVFGHPNLITLMMVGDGEAEAGPLATSWHINKFLHPVTDGAVLLVLHLNGYRINNPAVLARISHDELSSLLVGYGCTPYFIEGNDIESMHQAMAATIEHCNLEIKKYQKKERESGNAFRPRWLMIVLRSPKGWTAFQSWMKGYKVEEAFDSDGKLISELRDLAPTGTSRMSASLVGNGGLLRKPLDVPDFRQYAIKDIKPGVSSAGSMVNMYRFLREIVAKNITNFRIFGPDEPSRTSWERFTRPERRYGWVNILKKTVTEEIWQFREG